MVPSFKPKWRLAISFESPTIRGVGVAKVVIRMADEEDAPEVASVLRLAFAQYEALYTREGYAATTPGPATILTRMREGPLWVAVHDQCIIGTASAVLKQVGVYVRGMAVIPEARGLGTGRLLLEEIEVFAAVNGAARLFLNTTPFLHRAIQVYKAFGFRPTGEGPHELFGTPLFTMDKMVSWRTVSPICHL